MSYLQLAKLAEARLRAAREAGPGCVLNDETPEGPGFGRSVVKVVGKAPAEGPAPKESESMPPPTSALAPSTSTPWPAALPGLGPRRAVPFAACTDCTTDPPQDEIIKIGPYALEVPGQRGTFAAYGAVALCRRHAQGRAAGAA